MDDLSLSSYFAAFLKSGYILHLCGYSPPQPLAERLSNLSVDGILYRGNLAVLGFLAPPPLPHDVLSHCELGWTSQTDPV